jgi:hypothetical protein
MLDVNGTGRFVGSVTSKDVYITNSANADVLEIFQSPSVLNSFIDYPSGRSLILRNKGTAGGLTLANTGAATFSSSVTAGGKIFTSTSVADNIIEVINSDTTNGYGLYVRAGGTASGRYVARFKNGADSDVMWVGPSNVGIGTNNPVRTLHLNSASDTRLLITDDTIGTTTNDGTYYRQSGVNAYIVNQENGTFQIGTNNSYFLTAAASGAATFTSSVTATSFFESSSIKGKDIIATNPLLALDIDVIKYTRKSDESKDIRYGYSAEQIHSLMPELTDKDVTAVKYLDVHTILISQLQKEIKELKAKMN